MNPIGLAASLSDEDLTGVFEAARPRLEALGLLVPNAVGATAISGVGVESGEAKDSVENGETADTLEGFIAIQSERLAKVEGNQPLLDKMTAQTWEDSL